jgi:uncharacterized protein YndB with AHSA1/START domain
MKILKIIGGVVAGLIVLVLIVAAIAPKNYAVIREVTIARPPADVFTYVKYLKNQEHFSVWAQKDPAMAKEYRGTDGTVGFVSAWDSKMEGVGKGEQEITNITDGKRIDYALHFIKPFDSRSDAYMTFEPDAAGGTKVQWGFTGKMPFPMNLIMLVMNMDASVGKDLADGLANLKAQVEK